MSDLEQRGGERGFGLAGMREQIELLGGTFRVDSAQGPRNSPHHDHSPE
jgi:signal transduction histidine kinase